MRARLVVLLGLSPPSRRATVFARVAGERHERDVVDLVPDYAVSPAASIDAAGIGGAQIPEELQLTVEQKAAIAALHDAFMKANAADVAALRAIEQEARAAIRAGKTRDEVRAIVAKGDADSRAARRRVQEAAGRHLGGVHAGTASVDRVARPRNCGPGGVRLTEDQVQADSRAAGAVLRERKGGPRA